MTDEASVWGWRERYSTRRQGPPARAPLAFITALALGLTVHAAEADAEVARKDVSAGQGCPTLALQATLHSSGYYSGDVVEVELPADLPVTAGNAFNGQALLRLDDGMGSFIECGYTGGAPGWGGATLEEAALGLRYYLQSCSNGAGPGFPFPARYAELVVLAGSDDQRYGLATVELTLGDRNACFNGSGFDFNASTRIARGPGEGEIIFDAGGRKFAFPTPAARRYFQTEEEFALWTEQELNAIRVYDDNGVMVGVRGTVAQLGTPIALDANYNPVAVNDVIVGYVGGLEGVFEIGSTVYDMNSANAMGPADYQCSGGFCTYHEAFRNSFFGIYTSVGTEMENRSGGYDHSYVFCWKWGFVPWVCSRERGWNQLRIENQYFGVDAWGVPHAMMDKTVLARNVEDLTVKEWEISFGISGGSFVKRLSVCGRHDASGQDSNSSIHTAVSEGSTWACY